MYYEEELSSTCQRKDHWITEEVLAWVVCTIGGGSNHYVALFFMVYFSFKTGLYLIVAFSAKVIWLFTDLPTRLHQSCSEYTYCKAWNSPMNSEITHKESMIWIYGNKKLYLTWPALPGPLFLQQSDQRADETKGAVVFNLYSLHAFIRFENET